MARVVVDVMLKPEILDPQGQAVANALPRLGVTGVTAVRIGKRIEIEFDGEPDLEQAREIADKLLANPVIEDFTVRVEETAPAGGRHERAASVSSPSPGRSTTATRPAPSRSAGADAGPALARRRRPARRRRGRPARRLLLRRLPALRRDRPVRPGDGDDRRRGPRRPAGARHLQRLPDPVRVAPAARRADPQRAPALPLPRPAAARSSRPPTAWTTAFAAGQEIVIPLKNGEGRYVADERTLDELEAEGRVVARYVGEQPERLAARHRRRSATRPATSSASCRTPSTRSRR